MSASREGSLHMFERSAFKFCLNVVYGVVWGDVIPNFRVIFGVIFGVIVGVVVGVICLQQSQLRGSVNRFHTTMDVEFAIDVLCIRADSADRHNHFAGNLSGREFGCQKAQGLQFALG